MKKRRLVIVWLKWLLYAAITQNARTRYSLGVARGMHCSRLEDVSRFLPGHTQEATFQPGVKPYREYKTIKEFFAQHAQA